MTHHRTALSRTATASVVCAMAFSSVSAGGPLGRTVVLNLVHNSGANYVDMNGDCEISDIDIALRVYGKLIQQYGAQLEVGDLDSDGELTAADLQFAIYTMLKMSFGKPPLTQGPVNSSDVGAVLNGLVSGDEEFDVDMDASVSINDVAMTQNLIGLEPSDADLFAAAWELYEYIGLFETMGTEIFMRPECLAHPGGHVVGISNTWPSWTPVWWRANHYVSISESYGTHSITISRSWPANHDPFVSKTWQWGEHVHEHSFLSNPTDHTTNTSSKWPANHSYAQSSTWTNHEELVSRAWPPGHDKVNSDLRQFPAAHSGYLSGNWSHGTASSSHDYPPNHGNTVSQTWGSHNTGPSSTYPPNHSTYASNTWPGPQPGWPPSHSGEVSASWGEPAPNPWPPIVPPDHSWLTTFNDVR
jgi:hypothetical protein